MGYSPFKMTPKSPLVKALKGNQHKLPQHLQEAIKAAPESPAKQTTYGEIMHQKSLKDKEMGKRTKVIDKFISAAEAPFSDKTYAELKKEKRAAQKKKYEAENPSSPAKLKDACYHKVKAQYDVFPSAYASGAIAKCRKNKGKK